MRVLHAHWRPSSPGGGLLFWAEVQPDGVAGRSSRKHPFCADAGNLRHLLGESGAEAETFTLLLPGNSRRPFPSPQVRGVDPPRRGKRDLRAWEIQGLRPARAVELLVRLLEPDSLPPDVRLGDSLRYWQRAAQLALEALAGQQTIPGLKHREDGLYARWLPLLDNQRLERLAAAMPPVCRADPREAPAPRALLEDFLEETCDALVREWSSAPEPLKDPSEPGSRWARALFGHPEPVRLSAAQREDLERSHRLWLATRFSRAGGW